MSYYHMVVPSTQEAMERINNGIDGYSGHIDPPTGDTDPPSKFIF